ncbi:MAG TPA: OmpW family outer membrane protein [Thermoanaerobaculia bacterium]|nr:OmpW family outer membrane protein [Thermoanaerobaculia bacterium]
MRISVLLFSVVLIALPAAAADQYDVQLGSGLLAFPGNGHIQRTSEYLRVAPRAGPALAADLWLRDKTALQIAASEAWPRVAIRDGGEGRRIRVVPLSFSLLQRVDAGAHVQPYVGAGIELPLLRRGNEPVAGIARIEQPDHVALVLQAGARVPLGQRWWIGMDAKVLPAESTLETHRAEYPRDALQTNFHPLVLATGLGVRF